MYPNSPDYKIITIPSQDDIGITLTTTYTNKQPSVFNFNTPKAQQKYPIVINVNEKSDAYKQGLRKNHTITKLNGYSMEYKDCETIISDFIYEKKSCDTLKLTII